MARSKARSRRNYYRRSPAAMHSTMMVQTKLTVGDANDAAEHEADATADTVMRMPEQSFIQRKCTDCEKEEKLHKKPLVQAKAEGTHVSNGVANNINASKGKGSTMDSNTQSFMSTRFGTDFRHIKIHTDGEAVQLNRQLNAKAFTVGSDIYFNQGQYQPNSTTGRFLLAHELTHTVQQGYTSNSSSTFVQRAPNPPTMGTMPAGGTITQPTEADIRQSVTDATSMLTTSADFFQLATVDSARLERTLSGWITMANTYPNLIATRLNNDAALLQAFQQAFNNAVRSLFMRYASVPANQTSVINLYLTNLHRLPEWSRPNLASFNLNDDTKRRSFVTSYTTALNNTALFSGFSAITTAQLESVLGYLFTLTTDTQNMLATNLNNDATLLDALRPAYRAAINNLLTRAALALPGETVLSLFMRYRYQRSNMIHEWGDQQLSGTTPAAPLGTTGGTAFTHNGFSITIRADGTQAAGGAMTHSNMAFTTSIGRNWDGSGIITSFTPPMTPTIAIWTDYGPGASPTVTSGYGRGTTVADRRLGNTSLGHHERSHSRDFLSFVANNPAPVFTGSVGMTRAAFATAVSQYVQALRNYSQRLNRSSELATDCVGTPNIEAFHTANGTHSTVSCH